MGAGVELRILCAGVVHAVPLCTRGQGIYGPVAGKLLISRERFLVTGCDRKKKSKAVTDFRGLCMDEPYPLPLPRSLADAGDTGEAGIV